MKQRGYIFWTAAPKWAMKWVNLTSGGVGEGGGNQKYAGFEDHVVIFSLLSFFSFPFSPLRTTQTSKAVLSTVMLICRRCQSILHCRRLNRPWYWICPRNQWRLEASTNPAMRDFCREPFRINIESFQALCRILSIFMFSFRSSSLPMENYVASGLLRLSNVSSYCGCCLPDAIFISLCTCLCYVKQHSPHTHHNDLHILRQEQCTALVRDH